MNTAPTVKLHLYFARGTDSAVILHQGASKVFRMILWHRATDTFEDGQWVNHKIYPEECDLSPDGRHFLYFALDGKWGSTAKGSFTAISQPPYFTALSLFPVGSTWAGGGVFINESTFVADGDPDIIKRAEGLTRFTRTCDPKAKRLIYHTDRGRDVSLPKLEDPTAPYRSKPNAARSHPDYETDGAHLYRVNGPERTLIRDFAEMAFEPMRAPYDWRNTTDGVTTAWHPLDQDTP